MYGKYFQYDGEISSSYNLIIGGLEVIDLEFAMQRDVMRGDFNRYRYRLGHMGTKWSNPLEFRISLIKDVCSEPSQRNLIFTEEEVNAINRWLTSPDYPTLFHMYDYDFERDSLNNMILINHQDPHCVITLYAEDYNPVSYEINGDECNIVLDDTPADPDLLTPPRPRVRWHNGYYSFQYYTDDYPSKVTDIYTNDGVHFENGVMRLDVPLEETLAEVKDGILRFHGTTRYKRVETNEWLSAHQAYQELNEFEHKATGVIQYQPLVVYHDNDELFNSYTILLNRVKTLNVKYDYFGLFTNIEPQVMAGMVVGFTATFTTNSPFAWTYELMQYMGEDTDNMLNFNVYSAEKYRELYPIIDIHVPSDAESQSDDDRSEIILDLVNDEVSIKLRLKKGATTTIDCEKCTISYVLDDDTSGAVHYDVINNAFYDYGALSSAYIIGTTVYFSDVSTSTEDLLPYDSVDDIDWGLATIVDPSVDEDTCSFVATVLQNADSIIQTSEVQLETGLSDTRFLFWPRLYDGQNEIRAVGDCSVLVKYREPRKVGDW